MLVRATTPQVFSRELYERAINNEALNTDDITDDNMLVEQLGEAVYTVIFEEENPKITTKSDLKYAELLLLERCENV